MSKRVMRAHWRRMAVTCEEALDHLNACHTDDSVDVLKLEAAIEDARDDLEALERTTEELVEERKRLARKEQVNERV